MADANNRLEGVKTWWRGLSTRNKWLVGGGVVLLVLALSQAETGGQLADLANSQGYDPDAQGQVQQVQDDQGPGYAGEGDQGQGFVGGTQADQGQGYAGQGYQGQAGAPDGQNGGGQTETDPTGYWARQRSQDQQSQAFGGYIRDTNTIRDNETGEVHSDVPNAYADPAVESGSYSQVPTAELPTSAPAPAAPEPAPASTPAE